MRVLLIFVNTILLITAIGCASMEEQTAESITSNNNTSKSSFMQRDAQSSERQQEITRTFPYAYSIVKKCILQMLQERGIPINEKTEDEHKTIITTLFQSLTEETLKHIAIIPMQACTEWKKGMHTLRITVSPDTKKSTIITISLRILGYCETSLPMLRPSPWLPLTSNGTLEEEIFTAILHCCEREDTNF